MSRHVEPVVRRIHVRVAASFAARLRGLIGAPPLAAGDGLWIAPCCAVHTFGMSRAIDLVFLDADHYVVAVHAQLPPRRLRVCWLARAALELAGGFAAQAGIQPGARLRSTRNRPQDEAVCTVESTPATRSLRQGRWRRRMSGSGTLEWLIAAPLVLLLGLGVLQWGLLLHARQALDYAVQEATRAGAVGAAGVAAIERGLGQGLLPIFGGSSPARPVTVALPGAITRVRAGQAAGWLQWRQVSPTRASFADWGEPARDPLGGLIAGAIEIPNDNLRHRPRVVGTASGQTLADANLLKLDLTYGVPMSVPLVGELAVWWMELFDGCRPSAARMLGAVPLPASATAPGSSGPSLPAAQPWRCGFYRARDERGRAVPRWPVRVTAITRMHTSARLWAHTPGAGGAAAPGAGGAAAPGAAVSGSPAPANAGITQPSPPVAIGDPSGGMSAQPVALLINDSASSLVSTAPSLLAPWVLQPAPAPGPQASAPAPGPQAPTPASCGPPSG